MAQTQEAIYSHGTQNFIDHTPGGAIAAGEVVMQPATSPWLCGIANQAIAASALGALDISGIYKVKKTATHVFAVGAAVEWDISANEAVTDGHANGDGQIGIAVAAAASADDYVLTQINVAPQPT